MSSGPGRSGSGRSGPGRSGPRRALLVGAGGQLGRELALTPPPGIELDKLTRLELDVTNATEVDRVVRDLWPAVILNAAAYTAVDRAEDEPEAAFAVNREGPAHLARAAQAVGSRLIHVSTDFVFDGFAEGLYEVSAAPAPASVYGRSKLAGEESIRELLGDSALILRTSRVYSCHGENFVKTMLRLMSERDSLDVVADQTGSPTWAALLARGVWRAAELELAGTWHWSDEGTCTWFEFATAVQEAALERGLLAARIPIRPVATEAFPAKAERPRNSALATSSTYRALGLEPVSWRTALGRMLDEMRETIHA